MQKIWEPPECPPDFIWLWIGIPNLEPVASLAAVVSLSKNILKLGLKDNNNNDGSQTKAIEIQNNDWTVPL